MNVQLIMALGAVLLAIAALLDSGPSVQSRQEARARSRSH